MEGVNRGEKSNAMETGATRIKVFLSRTVHWRVISASGNCAGFIECVCISNIRRGQHLNVMFYALRFVSDKCKDISYHQHLTVIINIRSFYCSSSSIRDDSLVLTW